MLRLSTPLRRRAALTLFALTLPGLAPAQTVLSNDHSVAGNLCVGASCTGSETFFYDMPLKINDLNTGIYFEDVSICANTQCADWAIRINDDDFVGGANYFGIEDATDRTLVFRIDDGAPANALYVANDGDIGLRTGLPQADLHIEASSTADIRLNRNTSGGFFEQSFDLEVNDLGFSIRDNLTNRFIFNISPDAPERAINIQANRLAMNDFNLDYDIVMQSASNAAAFFLDAALDRIGMGTGTPDAPLHVLRASTDSPGTAPAGILVETTGTETPRGLMTLRNNGNVFFALENTAIAAGDNTGRQWNFQNNGGEFRVTTAPGGGNDIEMRLLTNGDMIIEGDYFSNSNTPVPDYVFAPDYDLKPLSEVQAFIDTHSHLPGVPSAADINAQGLNMTDMQMRLLKKVEELTLYTLEQEDQIARQQIHAQQQADRLARQEAQMVSVLGELAALRARLD